VRAKAIYISKAIARRLVWGPSDLLRLLRSDGQLVAPRSLSFVGRSDFEQTGREFLDHFVSLGGLKPEDRVLDVGCGIGRMAIPMTGYLKDGSYEGFDVGKEMINWCRRRITPRHPRFHFRWAPIYNRKYNPFGTISALEFRFPYEDDSFDFVLATSLFTHLTRYEAAHYLSEIGRVLRPGGTAFLTFFLLTLEAEGEVTAGRAAFDFKHEVNGSVTINPRQPEEAVAFRLSNIEAMLADAGLEIRQPIHRGSWANVPDVSSLQDIVVAGAGGA
jgi:SAM-dependent methyltransferase